MGDIMYTSVVIQNELHAWICMNNCMQWQYKQCILLTDFFSFA